VYPADLVEQAREAQAAARGRLTLLSRGADALLILDAVQVVLCVVWIAA
jgi:hypothetical protein